MCFAVNNLVHNICSKLCYNFSFGLYAYYIYKRNESLNGEVQKLFSEVMFCDVDVSLQVCI